MKVLISGGSGFIGTNLTQSLLEHGHEEVRILTRDTSNKQGNEQVKYFRWDVENGEMDMAALMGVDAVINLAGENISDARWSEEKKDKIYNSRINATNLLHDKLKELRTRGLPLPKKFVSTSAIGIYGDRSDEELTCDSSISGDFLAEVCQHWESSALRIQNLEIDVKILRVGIVLSSEGGALAKMLPAFNLGLAGRIGTGHQYMSWIHIRDLCDLYRFLIEHDTEKQVINGVAPNPIENIDFTQTLGRVLHRPTFIPLPEFAAKTIFGEMSQIMLASQKVSCEETKACGFEYSFNFLEAALRDTLKNHSE